MRADVEDYFHFWGKAEKGGGTSFHRLAFHCLDVAAVGEALFEADPRLLRSIGGRLGPDTRRGARSHALRAGPA